MFLGITGKRGSGRGGCGNSIMIENSYPENWKDLQAGVCRILNEIGISAEINKSITTPRGTVEIDVYAIDEKGTDRIKFIIECKNWKTAIPQSVVHSFTTVMHEVGANIGFIISKVGFQSGAQEYVRNTNITVLTYEQFQQRYFHLWYQKIFVPRIGDAVDALIQYVEPFNHHRETEVAKLPEKQQGRFRKLVEEHFAFGITMGFFEFPRYSERLAMATPINIEEVKKTIREASVGLVDLKSKYFRDLLDELLLLIRQVTEQFNEIFGRNIFAQKSPNAA